MKPVKYGKENPKLEQNKLSDGRISLYLEYYLGREEKPVLDENGNQVYYDSGKMQGKPKFAVKHNRRKENLSLYLFISTITPRKIFAWYKLRLAVLRTS